MKNELVIVLDFGGQYNQLVARRVRECNVYCEIYSYKTDLQKIKDMNRILDEHIGIDALPDKLKIVARLRWNNPEASLKELEEMMNGTLSKSGIGHRLKKLEALALTYDPMGLEEV